jgi:hypothetical protein
MASIGDKTCAEMCAHFTRNHENELVEERKEANMIVDHLLEHWLARGQSSKGTMSFIG